MTIHRKRTQDPWIIRNLYALLISLAVLAALFIATVLWSYGHIFGSVTTEHARWAQFGAFVGGSLGPTLSLLALLGTLMALWSSVHELRRKQRDDEEEEAEKRVLVCKLLRDEITERWQKQIAPDLDVLKQMPPLKAANDFVHDKRIVSDDMIVFKLIGTSFSDYYFLKDPMLLSEIIHGHVLMRDLVDLQTLVKVCLVKDSNWVENSFHDRLGELLSAMNARYESVLSKISI